MIELPVLTYELMRAATGNPIVVSTLDGQPVRLRLATPSEALQLHQHARAAVTASLGEPLAVPPITPEQAEELCAPLEEGRYP